MPLVVLTIHVIPTLDNVFVKKVLLDLVVIIVNQDILDFHIKDVKHVKHVIAIRMFVILILVNVFVHH